jgi:prepilin-type N-terminal cleavage/methylation domain-containing protein
MQPRLIRGRTDRGFTLIEVLIVISILGTIVSSLAFAFVAIVKTSPNIEVRIDDARSTRGLATWLSHDTTSAPPFLPAQAAGGIDISAGANDCMVPGGSNNILHLTWRERGFDTKTYVANYRYVVDGGVARIVRYSCSNSGAGYSTPSAINLTSGLSPATPPVVTPNFVGTDVASVDLLLTAKSGTKVLIETGSRNPVEFYP